MIPENWKLRKFGEVIVMSQYGLSLTSDAEGRYPMFKMNNFKYGKMIASKLQGVDLGDDEAKKYILKKGDLLFNRTNSLELVGKTGIFDLEGDFVFASYLVRFRINNELADPYYVNYFMNWENTQKKLKDIATKGVSQSNINPTNLCKFLEVPLPPLPEQKKIAEILGSWDTAIEQLETLIEKKQLLKRGLMQKLLSGKVRFPEFEGEEWGTAKIAQFFEEVSNKNKKNNQYTILSCSKIYGIVPQDQVFYKRIASEDIARYKIVEYSNLVYDPMLLWDASIGFVESVEKGVISPAYNTFKFIGTDGLWQYFRYLFKSHHFREKYKNISQGTNVRRRKAPAEDFLNIEFEISTSLNEKKHIISFLESLESELHNLFAQLEALKTQKLGLMQQLLTGKRRV